MRMRMRMLNAIAFFFLTTRSQKHEEKMFIDLVSVSKV